MILILQDIRSLHNVGSIFRTADAAGIKKIYLCGVTSAPVDRFGDPRPQVVKVSLGAEKSVPWEKVDKIEDCIASLKESGFKIIAVEQHRNSIPYNNLKISKTELSKTALLLGAEINGLKDPTLKLCDAIIEIPMFGKKESLNVAVAFGIVAFRLSENKFN